MQPGTSGTAPAARGPPAAAPESHRLCGVPGTGSRGGGPGCHTRTSLGTPISVGMPPGSSDCDPIPFGFAAPGGARCLTPRPAAVTDGVRGRAALLPLLPRCSTCTGASHPRIPPQQSIPPQQAPQVPGVLLLSAALPREEEEGFNYPQVSVRDKSAGTQLLAGAK